METTVRSEDDASDFLYLSPTPLGRTTRRSMLQIRMEILKVVMNGSCKPTQIMYRANLSWTVLQAQLKIFLNNGLLKLVKTGSRRRYEITDRGREMILSYEKLILQVLKE